MTNDLSQRSRRPLRFIAYDSGKYFFLCLFFIFLAVLTVTSLFFTTYYGLDYEEIPLYRHDHPLLLLLPLLVFIGIFTLLNAFGFFEKINGSKLVKLMLIYTSVVSVGWIFLSRSVLNWDQFFLSEAADQFCDNNFTYLKEGNYLYFYPYQLGVTAFLELLYRIFGKNSFLVFQLFNVLAVDLGFYGLYRITDLIFDNERTNQLLLFLLLGCIPMMQYCTFVYGNVWGFSLSIVAVWTELEFLESRRIAYFVLSALAIGMAVLLKSNSKVVLVGMIVVLLLEALRYKKIGSIFLPLFFILSVFLQNAAINGLYAMRSELPINDGVPVITWAAMGLMKDAHTPGWYNGFAREAYFRHGFSREKTEEESKQLIKDSIKRFRREPKYAVSFFSKKFVSQWNDPTFQGFWISRNAGEERSRIANSFYGGKLHHLSLSVMNLYHFLVVFASLCYVLFRFRKAEIRELLLAIIVFGGFLFHMIWEAKGQYTLPYFTMLLPYAARGLCCLTSSLTTAVLRLRIRVK